VRRVLDVMRGRRFEDAIIMMEYMPYRACEDILKALKSVSDNGMVVAYRLVCSCHWMVVWTQ
jgi:ribosomal protein L22